MGEGYIQFGGKLLAKMQDVDEFPCQEEHGADAGAIQQEIDATGRKLVLAYNLHDRLVAGLRKARHELMMNGFWGLVDELDGLIRETLPTGDVS